MDLIAFSPTEEQQSILAAVRTFAAEEIRPSLRACEESGALPDALAARAIELGLPLLEYPEHLGGLGLGMTTRILVEEELAWGDAGVAAALPGPGMGGYGLLECGTPPQANRLLSAFRDRPQGRGALVCAADGLPGSVIAERVPEGWRITGRASLAAPADALLFVVAASTSDATSEVFALDRTTPGVSVGERCRTLGLAALASAPITFDAIVGDEARLPAADRLGRVLEQARLVTAARAVGLARAALEYAARYALERRAFGRTIAEHEAVAFMAADMNMLLDAARLLLYRAAWRFDRGEPAGTDVAMALAHALEAAGVVSSHAVQILGGHGYVRDHPVEKWMRDAKTLALIWGTAQEAHHVIVEAALRGA